MMAVPQTDKEFDPLAFVLDPTDRTQSERNSFLVQLDDATRPLVDPDEIVQTAARLLGEYLRVDRCTYCTFESDQDTLEVAWDYTRPGIPSMVGRYSLAQFGAECARLLKANLPQLVEDVETDPLVAEVRDTYGKARIRAHASVPLHKAGRLVAAIGAHQQTPRRWLPEEVELVQLVANRCWESIEQAHVTRALQESERQFRTLAETIPHLAWMADETGHIFWYNRRWYDYTGVTFEAMEGWGWQKVHDPAVLPNVLAQWQGTIATGEPFEMVFPIKGADGAFRSFLTRIEPVRDNEGRVVRWFGTNTDITEQRRTEEELRRMNHELEEFAYVASHDLQEPLRMVNIYTQLLLKRLGGEDAMVSQYAGFVRQGVTRMEALINDLLTFSRLVHTEPLPVGAADLSASLNEALSVLKSHIEESRAVITSQSLPTVRGETLQMAHVFQNILSNALKYRTKDVAPEIHISAELDGGQWVISVRDNGIGFEPQYAERIFGLFKRLHNQEYPGTGLGLAICQRVVQRYGGRMWAEGRLGAGATFRFSLPPVEER
jgi:PAS domain S-box-containing protein